MLWMLTSADDMTPYVAASWFKLLVTVLLTLVTLLLKVLALLRSVAWLSSLVESLVLRLLDSVAT